MMEVLNCYAEHWIIGTLALCVVCGTLVGIAEAIGRGLRKNAHN